ncbi:MAG: putative transporter component [Pseudomonadota bacterium]|jgi:uncharacterized protein (TIGR01244 family)
MPEIDLNTIASNVIWATFVVTILLGIVLQKTRFCTMGAVTDLMVMGEWTRMRQWLLAIGVAVMGVGVMAYWGVIDPNKSIYTSSRLTWLSTVVGGLMFGFGMVLASGCGSKTLIRIGAGNLKSLVVFLTLSLSSYMTLKGIFGVVRVNTVDTVAITLSTTQDLPSILAAQWGVAKNTLQLGLALVIGAALMTFALSRKDFWSLNNLLAGFGGTILAIWWISGSLGYVAEDPNTLEEVFVATNSGRMESLTYVAPYAYVIEWLTFFSDTSKKITLGIVSVFGLVVGSTIYSLVTRTFRWESFKNAEDTGNHLVGGVLMGIGGVTAMGCTIGQGLTGISTLALNSFIAIAAFMLGAVLAMKYLQWRLLPPPCEPVVAGSSSTYHSNTGGCGMPLQIACHTDQFGTLGQIAPEDVAEIARQGYKSIINNRPDGEGGPAQPLNADVEKAAKALGLNYVYLPVVSGQITLEQAQEMARLLETLPGPILAFCRSGARSTNLYMLAQQVG